MRTEISVSHKKCEKVGRIDCNDPQAFILYVHQRCLQNNEENNLEKEKFC